MHTWWWSHPQYSVSLLENWTFSMLQFCYQHCMDADLLKGIVNQTPVFWTANNHYPWKVCGLLVHKGQQLQTAWIPSYNGFHCWPSFMAKKTSHVLVNFSNQSCGWNHVSIVCPYAQHVPNTNMCNIHISVRPISQQTLWLVMAEKSKGVTLSHNCRTLKLKQLNGIQTFFLFTPALSLLWHVKRSPVTKAYAAYIFASGELPDQSPAFYEKTSIFQTSANNHHTQSNPVPTTQKWQLRKHSLKRYKITWIIITVTT